MLQICRVEDGEIVQVNASLRDIERIGSLELFLHQETGVEEDAILAFLSDGRHLRNDNVRELAGAQDQSIYVFNKRYLDLDLDEVLHDLRIEPPLQPPIEDTITNTPPFRPSQLAASYLRIAHTHQDHLNHMLLTLRYQHEALGIFSNSLDLNVLNISGTFDTLASEARTELDKQASLLAGLETDLEIVGRVKVHVEFFSPAARLAIENGDPPRTLGNYVSKEKMRNVAEMCRRTHEDLQARFSQTQEAITKLNEGADDVRAQVADKRLLEEADGCSRRAQDIFDKITDAAALLESPASHADGLIMELRQLDAALRNEVAVITHVKNSSTERCIRLLRQISSLNADCVQLPAAQTTLKVTLRQKTSFSHIQRLHNMLYAYGATLVEIVRRKEFAKFFVQRARGMLEVMHKLSSNEQKRRQLYRSEVRGLLPFDTRGLDDPVPTIDFTRSGLTDLPYSFEREDVDEFFHLLNELEQVARASADPIAAATVREARLRLEKTIDKMNRLESSFDRIAERSLLSSSRLSSSRRRLSEADDQAYYELAEQLRDAREEQQHQELLFQDERKAYQAEIDRLKAALQDADSTAHRADKLEREINQTHAQIESEITGRRILEERNAELVAEVESQRQALARALADATEQTKAAEGLRQELAQVHNEYQDVKEMEERHAAKVAHLLEDQARTLRNLEEARARGEDLETQIHMTRRESDDVRLALEEADREKDRLLRAQAAEHERDMRDTIAEADGDRAVLEHQFSELQATLEDIERQLRDARMRNEMIEVDYSALREEHQRLQRELRDAQHVEQVLREDLRIGRSSQSAYEERLEESNRLVAQILDVAICFRNSLMKAMTSAQAMAAHPRLSGGLGDSAIGHSVRSNINIHADEPPPIDPSDPTVALEHLRSFDHDQFLETISRTGSTIRKWQKQCKEYRERAKGKISFRNFAKSDLALFLPTRNSVSKPWAAFNVSFPHYFLNATGHLAEQLKTREWIVARITSITERVVDPNDPTSNPYGLGDGVKYYTLEVEDWTQPTPTGKRKTSTKKTSEDLGSTSQTSTSLPSRPPQAEVESSFEATRPPNSHLFPTRTRTASSPVPGPSSLSRLLAQAPVESPSPREPGPLITGKPPSPVTSAPPASPTQPKASPIRPGSRASRVSISSRFSGGRIPPFGNSVSGASAPPKAAATIALSGQGMGLSSPSEASSVGEGPAEDHDASVPVSMSPSPEGSPSDGMSNFVRYNGRRATSYHAPRSSVASISVPPPSSGVASSSGGISVTASGRLANFANSWGMSFGRKKRPEADAALPISPDSAPDTSERPSGDSRRDSLASELLKRL